MPVINKYAAVLGAFAAAQNIKGQADTLKAFTTAIPFNTLRGRLDAMREGYNNGIAPLLALGTAGQVNPVVAAFYAGSVPANTYTQLQSVGTTLNALFVAYDVVFDTLTPITHDPVTGHAYADIPLAQLSSLVDELDAVLAALVPLA